MQYVDHRAGGAPVGIEISTVVARLECTFVCVGLQSQIMNLIGSWADTMNWFWIYGVVRDQANGQAAQAAAAIKGQLGRADPQNYRRGDVMHTNYAIRGITHYEFNIAGSNVYLWDFSTNTRIIGTIDQNEVLNTFLHTAAVTVAPAITTVFPFQPGV
jgi:phage tail tube protein FII